MSFFAPRPLCCMLLGMILAGCEAQLDLSGVNAQQSRSTHRSDLFQALAHHQDTVITVGGMGAVVQSTDGGDSWKRTTLPGKPFLIDVTVCPDGSFHTIEKTDGLWSMKADGNWVRQPLPEMTEPQAMTCDSSNVIWVTGGFSTIIHSGDAGASWESWTIDEDLYLTTIQFVDNNHGIVTGEFGTVLLTENGGVSWDRADDLPDSFYPQSTFFSSPETGWVVGLNGTIWATDSGGQSWQQAPSGINIPLYGISGFGDTLVAVGENTTILYYSPGDSSWNLLDGTVKSRTYLRGIIGMDGNQFIAAGGGGALFTVTVPQNEPGDS
jgi:photosystem II stability/assembly factor-like uncharacterized protein